MATSPRKPYHHGALREALVTAARALVDAEGAEGLTLRKAAAAAGVSHAAAYRHFADKASLVAAVMAQGFAELASVPEPDGTPLRRLHGTGRAYLEFALANPSLYRLMFGSADVPRRADFPDLAAAEQRVYARIAAGIEAAQASGELAPHPVADVTLLMSCVMHGLCSQLLAGLLPVADADELAATVMSLVDKGLAAR
ncbi:TetR/AcrR family transcriptional regulator [Saccharothrix variisporea]|uniref:TetR family transcriptional regulator n=1 Tax=Saccharothrix variisporea TaxID=543527 RepID=A0A495XIL6_9PSEU|nr:TetR-like C-terminal domain-containing protein [Saccharothrix variisporea]RKT72966.1 TetR family transcriptional regulator [Saccharothrix variisporea]